MDSENRRDSPRVQRGVTVVIRYAGGEQVAILVNTSPSGAMLNVHPVFSLPRRFAITLADQVIPVQLAWRSADKAGVKVEDPHKFGDALRRLLVLGRPPKA